ncbi:MAG: methyl-accepting chemotaxis protein [Ruminiclostridium sp.]|nr:methyl-accepting chemotaxis protein [Ruminiclostridium sp.]
MKKIQTKITVMVVLATICVSLLTGILSMLVTRYSTIAAMEKSLLETAEVAALAAENMISTYTVTISEIASNPALLDPNTTPQEKQAFIQSRVDTYYMRFGGMADANGYDAAHQTDIAQEPFFQTAIQGNTYMSSPYINGSDSYMVVSAPIRDGDSVRGVLYFQCDTTLLQSIIEGIQIGEGGEAYILDKNGTTIAYVDQQSVLDQENVIQEAQANPDNKDLQTVAAIERRMVAGESGVVQYTYSEDNSNNMLGFSPVNGTDGWSIAVDIDKDEFLRPAAYGNLFQLIACVVLCLIVIAVAYRVSLTIASPIVRCAARLQALARGDLKSPVPQVQSRDETRILSDSTAALVDDLDAIVAEIGRVLSAIAGGDLTQESDGQNYPGDFAVLQHHLQVITRQLNQTMEGIVSAAGQVSTSSAQVAATGGTLSQGAVEQSAAVEQLSATISDMSRDAQNTAQLTDQARQAVNGAGNKLQESQTHIDGLNKAMEQNTAYSAEIGRIIDTLENIAFQTNILALNAAVEAARAGSLGKGFAVVADEVRNLATKSDQAAKATQELVRHSVETVEGGSQVVASVTRSVTDVVDLAAQAVERMGLVSRAVDAQADAIEQVAQGIDQISGVVQSNSATAEESAATSQELSGQADSLKSLVGRFTLKDRSVMSGSTF